MISLTEILSTSTDVISIGLTCGMGNLLYSLVFTGIAVAGLMTLDHFRFGEFFNDTGQKVLGIMIPEDLYYGEIFDDLFEGYTKRHKLTMVKTTNLEISCGQKSTVNDAL